MKKKLEAELISIAHRILKLKNKSDLLQLHLETRNLYEKLSILKFAEENFGEVKPTIGLAEIQEKLETAFEENEKGAFAETTAVHEPETVEDFGEAADEVSEPEIQATEASLEETTEESEPETAEAPQEEAYEPEQPEEAPENPEPEAEPIVEAEPEIPAAEDTAITPEAPEFKPSFELAFDRKEDEPQEKTPAKQITFEDLLGHGYDDPVFVKADEIQIENIKVASAQEIKSDPQPEPQQGPEPQEAEKTRESPTFSMPETTQEKHEPSSVSDHLSKSITIGLNDRIGFEKQLFGGSSEDLNRVLSQLNTFDTFAEAQDFIEDMVKPDYNNWEGKDDYAQRFMDIVEKKFS